MDALRDAELVTLGIECFNVVGCSQDLCWVSTLVPDPF